MVKKAKKAVRKTLKVLPKKMSSLIKLALADVRKAEQSSKFVVDMGVWYSADQELVCKLGDTNWSRTVSRRKVCVLCAAGSVIAFSLGGKGEIRTNLTEKLENLNHNQLEAIDYLRQGLVMSAAESLGIIHDYHSEEENDSKLVQKFDKLDTEIPDYERDDPEPFHRAMKALEGKLRKAGL